VHNANFENLARGIFERLFFVTLGGVTQRPPLPHPEVYAREMDYISASIIKATPKTVPFTRNEFCEQYTARQRTRYEAAAYSLTITPVCKKDAVCSTFTKTEKINFSAKRDPAPRIIQPRDARYNIEVGRSIKALEPLLVKSVAALFNSPTIVKGLNADGVGRLAERKWNRFTRPVAISLDATRFDQHMSQQALTWEHNIYVQCLAHQKDRTKLRELLSWQLVNYGRIFIDDKKVTYGVEGCRMSGDMNTGIGNCIVASALCYHFFCSNGFSRYELLNNGDDCVLFIEQADLHLMERVEPFFLRFGFSVVVEEPVYELEHIEFCQSRFINIGDGYRMIRTPKTAASKDTICVKPFPSFVQLQTWVHLVGSGGLALNSGVPVMQAYYEALLRNGRVDTKSRLEHDPLFQSGTKRLTRNMVSAARSITQTCRYSFWLATGILPDAQIAMEEYYATVVLLNAPSPDEGFCSMLF